VAAISASSSTSGRTAAETDECTFAVVAIGWVFVGPGVVVFVEMVADGEGLWPLDDEVDEPV
jgi:hypothetical protein